MHKQVVLSKQYSCLQPKKIVIQKKSVVYFAYKTAKLFQKSLIFAIDKTYITSDILNLYNFYMEVKFMKKFFKLTSLLVAVLAMTFVLTACGSSFGKVEKALEGIGYEKIESTSQADKYTSETDVPVEAACFKKVDGLNTNFVVVLEFEATEDMKEFYTDSAAFRGLVKDIKDEGTAEEFHEKLEDAGLAKGNCLVFSINPLEHNAVTNAIKNA